MRGPLMQWYSKCAYVPALHNGKMFNFHNGKYSNDRSKCSTIYNQNPVFQQPESYLLGQSYLLV